MVSNACEKSQLTNEMKRVVTSNAIGENSDTI